MRKLRHEEIRRVDPENLKLLPPHPISVVLHDIRSLYNVGSMFRSADAFRIAHLYLTGYTGTPEHPGLQKTALGAQDTVPWSVHEDVVALVSSLKRAGHTIAALEITDRPTPMGQLQPAHYPLCLIIGNELEGVSDELLGLSDLAVEIPQYGSKQSLNVAVAAGIALHLTVERYLELQ
jgi:tRNA G18 (ribose-2'-O)-methylase SpoU